MTIKYINAAFFVLIILAAAFSGLYFGQYILTESRTHPHSQSVSWHEALHDKLQLTADQHAQLVVIENRYFKIRKDLEEQIRLANLQLAQAIKDDKSFSARVRVATGKIHKAMGELQNATLQHLFEMRPLLTDDQNRKLEQMVTDALQQN